MKKIFIILFSFLGLGFLACLIIGFCGKPNVELLAKAVLTYKFCSGIELFTMILPALVLSGFLLSFSIYFGKNSEGSTSRFSKAMTARFKIVMIAGLICTFILTFFSEFVTFSVKRKKQSLANQPEIIKIYLNVGENFMKIGNFESARRYADEAFTLDPSNKNAENLRDRAETAIHEKTRKIPGPAQSLEYDALIPKPDNVIDADNLMTVYELYKKSKESYETEKWFDAHYFAEMALKVATGKDVNTSELKQISADSWNNLTRLHNLSLSDSQNFFNQKYEGYKALIEEDFFKSYYILKNLYDSNPVLQIDPDLVNYLEIATEKVNERAFFTDETLELQSFESANDVSFSLKYANGWTDIVFFKGMTQVKTSGGMVQYLRALSIYTMDDEGNFYSSMTVPYAKVLMVYVGGIGEATKETLRIPQNVDYIPYVLLKSIDRLDDGKIIRPEYKFMDPETANPTDYLMIRMDYSDFQMIENATVNPEIIPIGTLLKIISKAEYYGYSVEVYAQVLLNRLLFPFFILIFFVLIATISWNNRIGSNQYFKASWIFTFPLYSIIAYPIYQLLLFGFKLINYALLGSCNDVMISILCGSIFYVVCLAISSVVFLARRTAG